MDKCAGVYVITNGVNGKRYVGSTGDLSHRWRAHKSALRHNRHGSAKLQAAWNKYGEAAFEYRALIRCAPTMVVFYEQRVLDAYECVTAGYNTRPIADRPAGLRHTPEAIEKIRAAGRGRVFTPERRARIAAALRGRIVPEDQRVKIREKRALQVITPESIAKRSATVRGSKRREGTGRRISEALKASPKTKGRTLSPETRAKIGAAHVGRKNTPETIAKMRASRLAVIARKKVPS